MNEILHVISLVLENDAHKCHDFLHWIQILSLVIPWLEFISLGLEFISLVLENNAHKLHDFLHWIQIFTTLTKKYANIP